MSRETPSVSRRSFLKFTVGAGAGLVIGLNLMPSAATASEGMATFNPFVSITPDGMVTVLIKHLDKGQGIATGLATLVAEELDAAPEHIRVEFAPADAEKYKNLFFGLQGTGGSTAIPNAFMQYREAGATARRMLMAAAAARWDVASADLSAADSVVRHEESGRSASYGDLAAEASKLVPPGEVTLKAPDQWRYIGKAFPRVDVPEKSKGAAGIYGMDVQLDNMLVAVMAHPPKWGATLKSVDASQARKVNGVVEVLTIPQGVVVLATSTWPAIKGREALTLDWEESAAETRSTGDLMEEYRKLADTEGAKTHRHDDAEGALENAVRTVEAVYEFPYLAHAPMEPIDITVQFDGETATFWTGSQLQTLDHGTAAAVLGIDQSQVAINTLWAGGSFGRRAIGDSHYTAEAAAIAKAWGKPQPIKLIYTREDDIRGGYYRPAYVHKVKAGIDESGSIVGWQHRIVGQSILADTIFEQFLVKDGIDDTSVEGVSDMTYDVGAMNLELHSTKVGVPVLWWRSVGHTHTAYVVETMIDQLADAAGEDPVAYRRKLLKDDERKLGVLNLAAEKAGWDTPPPEGRHRGVAVHKSFNTYVAEIVEISLGDGGSIKVEKVVCAVDCGVVVNPDNVRAQIEGGIGYGLGAVLRNEITLTDGTVDQANFDTYEPLRIDDMPEVEVHIVDSGLPPTGIGEPGTPPIGPAVANAVSRATGDSIRTLPFIKHGIV
ncbi:molybdopterin cofactor-binding domain-containing protein [Minwuia sp.]|uniref:xanthine dehydrogenase family protein molybdopterin-binding subunit n=1 Tax=Minwuia sp. TaxID=2493630 RepID=UPI003A8CD9B9